MKSQRVHADAIITRRLRLRLLDARVLAASLDGDAARVAALLGLRVPADWLTETAVIAKRLGDWHADARCRPFSLRAIGVTANAAMVGHIGFHSCPDPAYLREHVAGGIELGYTVYPPYRRRGYAEEAIRALLAWASGHHGVRRFAVSVAPGNAASQALASKLGFVRVGSNVDLVDGTQDVLVLDLDPGVQARVTGQLHP